MGDTHDHSVHSFTSVNGLEGIRPDNGDTGQTGSEDFQRLNPNSHLALDTYVRAHPPVKLLYPFFGHEIQTKHLK